MAEQDDSEKTEEPTQRKLDEAQKKGDVVKSQEISTWFVMMGGAVAIALLGPSTASSLASSLKVFLAQPDAIPMDPEHLRRIWLSIGRDAFGAVIAPLGILVGAALIGHLIQHAPVFTAENMKPKLSKISPAEGLKRLFGPKSLMNLAKGVVKMAVVGTVSFMLVWPERDQLALMMTWEIAQLLPVVQAMALKGLLPRALRAGRAKPLADYAAQSNTRDAAIVAAYASGGYSMAEIGAYFGVHYSTVSRVVRAAERGS